MCGRYNLHTSPNEWVTALLPGLDFAKLPEFRPRFNIAPTQNVPVVRQLGGPLTDDGLFANAAIQIPESQAVRELSFLRWGLIPGWAKELGIGASMINARSETAHEKTSFRKPLSVRRCLVPVDGYYEWKRVGKMKQPFHISAANRTTLFFAGIWDANRSLGSNGQSLLTFSILTMAARSDLAEIHDRMPVFVPHEFCDVWLSAEPDGRQLLDHLLAVSDQWQFSTQPISDYVNNARHEGPECLRPAP
ncbi:MAG: SOS response-associated peptidase [Planctomycetaceae bacterium]|nr:SOS response-associated peptidase [Planctomycetaceae bacterium]